MQEYPFIEFAVAFIKATKYIASGFSTLVGRVTLALNMNECIVVYGYIRAKKGKVFAKRD